MAKMTQLSFAFTWFLLGMCLIKVSAKGIPTFAGPYRVVVLTSSNVSEDYPSHNKGWLTLHTTQVRGKQLQYGWGYSYLSEPITNDLKMEARMASRSNNQWKKNAFVFKFDWACSAILDHAMSYLRLFFGPNHDFKCPLKPMGLRKVENQSFELKFPHFPEMPYGRYLIDIRFIKRREIVIASWMDMEILPRL